MARTRPLRSTRLRRAAAWLAALGVAAAGPAGALTRDVTLRFVPPADSVIAGYVVYATDVGTGIEAQADVGFVTPDADGIARTTVGLDDATTYRVQMTAFNAYGVSPRSNEVVIQASAPRCDPAQCNDGNPCTADWCDLAGCANTPLQDGTQCDDGQAETVGDQCVQGACEGLLLACRSDGDCDDGNLCNGAETCGGSAGCLEGAPPSCGEPTACTAPGCTVAGGCFTETMPDGTACDDGRSDTGGDVCRAGVCQGLVSTPAPALALQSISPQAVSRGRSTLELRGTGFAQGAVVGFENGSGRPPKVTALSFVEAGRLSVTVDVSGGGRRASYFDVRVSLPDGRSAVLPRALRVDR